MTSMMGNQGLQPMKEKIPKGYSKSSIQQFTPEQMQLFGSLFGNVGPDSFLSKLAGGDQSMFDQMEAPAMRQFQEMQGQLGSRFSGMGMGARRGSGFQNAANQASSDFAQDLASKRMGLQMQALKDLMSMSGELLNQRPFEQQLMQKEKPWWQEMLIGAAPGASQALTAGLMGGI